MDPQRGRIQLLHPLVLVVDGMAAPLRVVADQLQRILVEPRIVRRAFRSVEPLGNAADIRLMHVEQLFAEDLDLAAGRCERHAVPDLLPERHRLVAGRGVHVASSFHKGIEIRKFRLSRQQVFVVDLAAPVLPGFAAVGKGFIEAHILGDQLHPFVFEDGAEQRLRALVGVQHVVVGVPDRRNELGLEQRRAGQHDVGPADAGGIEQIGVDDQLALAGIA